jgi:hypothetical protein
VDWKSTLAPVIPAEAGIQAVFEHELKTNLDAGVRRHDELSPRVKAKDLDDPEREINILADGTFRLCKMGLRAISFQRREMQIFR